MKSACVGVLSIIELKNARWNIENSSVYFIIYTSRQQNGRQKFLDQVAAVIADFNLLL